MRKKIIAIILAIAVISTLGIAVHNKTQSEEKPTKPDVDLYGDPALGISPEVDESLQDYDTYLLIGADSGKRSDIMLVMSVNKKTQDCIITTIDRDTYMQVLEDETVFIDGREYEFCKCNRSYQKGGLNPAMKELNRHLDLNIRNIAVIDWVGVADLIDTLGGLDVDVDEKMLTWINEDAQPKGSGDAEYKIEKAGRQTLSGWQAVQYLRARKYEGGNARVRSERNENILMQILDKTSKVSEDERNDACLKLSSSIHTNMSAEKLMSVLDTAQAHKPSLTGVWPNNFETMWDKDMHFYYHVPLSLESNVTELHKTLYGQENYKPSDECKALSERTEELAKELVPEN